MNQVWRQSVSCVSSIALVFATALGGCKSEKQAQNANPSQSAAPSAADQNAAQETAPGTAPASTGQALNPASLDDLVAPIALYPDQLLGQLLVTSTNPQEVLDLGNWLIQNPNLKGDAATAAAKNAGFTVPAQYLAMFPQVVDNMCQEMDWTTQLGDALKADQQGVMDAIQRKRAEAQRMGNLKSGAQLAVDTKTENGQQYVEIKSADPQVVYVPQYNPVTIYTTPAPAAPAQTTTVVTQNSGVSTETAVLVGLLSFGVGMAVGSAITRNNNYYPYPAWGYRGVYYGGRPYYPPPYRPPYYPGYRPTPYYRPPPNYHWSQYNKNVNVNVQNNNYYNRYNQNNNYNRSSNGQPRPTPYQGNNNQPNGGNQGNYRGQSTYQGARPSTTSNQAPGASMAGANPNRGNRGTGAGATAGSQPVPDNTNRGNRAGGTAGTQPAPDNKNRASAGNGARSANGKNASGGTVATGNTGRQGPANAAGASNRAANSDSGNRGSAGNGSGNKAPADQRGARPSNPDTANANGQSGNRGNANPKGSANRKSGQNKSGGSGTAGGKDRKSNRATGASGRNQ